MSSRNRPRHGAGVAVVASISLVSLGLFSSAGAALAADEGAPEAVSAAQQSEPELQAQGDEAPPVDPAPVPPTEPEPPTVTEPPVVTDPPPVVSGPEPVTPPVVPPVDPAPTPTDEPAVSTPTPKPTPTPTPSTPAAAPKPEAKPPATVPAPPSNQPPLADWSPGAPVSDEYQGSGDQGIPAVGIAGLIGDNYPAHYKNMPVEPVIWDEWNFAHRQCTSFVAWRLNQVNDVPFDNQFGGLVRWGNAGQWGDSARSLGIRVDTVPSPGAIAYSAPGTNGAGTAGHVAWVAKVLDDGSAVIEEYNAGAVPGRYGSRIVPPDAFTGYIHLKDLPKEIVPITDQAPTSKSLPAAQKVQLGADLLDFQPRIERAKLLRQGDLSVQAPLQPAYVQRVNFAQPLLGRGQMLPG